MKLSQLGEFGLIELLKKVPAKRKDTVLGIGDDCAALEIRNPIPRLRSGQETEIRTRYLLVTTDTLIEKVHFSLKKTTFYDLGYYALYINISDILSMGGEPTHAFVTIGAPGKTSVRSIQQLYKGIQALARKFRIDIAGGDTVSSSKFIISITLLGKVDKKYLMTRAGAKVGDYILATGEFGGPAARKYRNPRSEIRTRNKESGIISKSKLANAMIDSSDGLVRSVLEITKASKTGALIYSSEVPKAKGATLKQSLHGGEEYELVFTVSAKNIPKLVKNLGRTKVSIVGEILPKSKGVVILNERGRIEPVKSGGYEHFR